MNLTWQAFLRKGILFNSAGKDVTIPTFSTTSAGLVPATGTPSGKFLKDDGTWATGGGGGLKSVQKGVITGASASSQTATISTVDTSKSFVLFNGGFWQDANLAASANAQYFGTPYVVLTNATTVTATPPAGTNSSWSVAFTVVEFE